MTKPEMKIGEISKPRFEFRTFGQNFDKSAKRMARLSVPIPEKVWERESDEIYILSKTPTLPLCGENPPVATVENVWQTASKKSSPAKRSAIISMRVSAR